MKFSASLSTLLVILPLLAQQVSASPVNFQDGSRIGQNGAPQQQKQQQPAKSAPAKTTSKAVASASSSAAVVASSSAAAPPAASSISASDAQSSLTLDPAVIATGFENNGQADPEAGQVPSLTSSNNFINFCATLPQLPITNGLQIVTGSCNPAPMGVIAAQANMPASKFIFPTNGAVIPTNSNFTIQMAIENLDTGFFTNADENFFAAPQQVGSDGNIQGHSHVVIQLLQSMDQTSPLDPKVFAFFKGLNDAAVGGVLTADVTSGLPAGAYRLASINTAANHQPALVAVAQHGALDDMVYFTVSDDSAAASSSAAAIFSSTAAAAPPATSAAAVTSSAAVATSAPAAVSSVAAPKSSSAAAAPSTVAIKGANTGAQPGQQGGFSQPSQNKGNQASQNKGNQAKEQTNKPNGFFGGRF
ncbi:hypothetical protein CERSUDRAFT_146368 [Gelatoporia subvermispora B]|uniref:Uncharacterized protein n=1 Tax=Ceriporiopsis subvermispora (strain B) TaxID=914234 RepID=M2RSL6_CERS8|nr:hypothetical protein CERSUDRAFT_146368 [Gelatoporia subvermispora B]